MTTTNKFYRAFLSILASAAVLVFITSQTALADNMQTPQESLLARVQIEDLISN